MRGRRDEMAIPRNCGNVLVWFFFVNVKSNCICHSFGYSSLLNIFCKRFKIITHKDGGNRDVMQGGIPSNPTPLPIFFITSDSSGISIGWSVIG